MTRRRAGAAAAFAAAVALAVAACGGDDGLSKDEYRLRVLRIETSLAPGASRLFVGLVAEPLPVRTCAAKARQFHRVLQRIVEAADDIDPPREIAQLHRRFLLYARRSVAAVGKAAADVARGNLRCGEEYNDRVYGLPSTERAEEILTALRDRGYVVGGE